MRLCLVWFVLGVALGMVAGMSMAAIMLANPAYGVTHLHSSSRYDRSADSLSRAAHRYVKRADLITWTEVSANRRAARLHHLSGWRSYTPDHTDLGTSWKKQTWRKVRTTTRVLSHRHFTTSGGYRSPTQRVSVVVLDNRVNQNRMLVVTSHLPAGVQNGDRWKATPRRVATWKDAVGRLSELLPALQARWKPDLSVLTADWNIDLRRPVWRHRLHRYFPDLHLTWKRPFPRAGTHRGGRLIDATLTDGYGRARLVRDDGSSDHRPYVERLRRAS